MQKRAKQSDLIIVPFVCGLSKNFKKYYTKKNYEKLESNELFIDLKIYQKDKTFQLFCKCNVDFVKILLNNLQ